MTIARGMHHKILSVIVVLDNYCSHQLTIELACSMAKIDIISSSPRRAQSSPASDWISQRYRDSSCLRVVGSTAAGLLITLFSICPQNAL